VTDSRSLIFAALLLSSCSNIESRRAEPSRSEVRQSGLPDFGVVVSLEDRALREGSGLAASPRRSGVFWAVNDSGNAPELFAFDPRGRSLERFRIAGAVNRDWETLDSFVHRGKSYLMIGDIGDNGARRKDCRLYVVEEPVPRVAGQTSATTSVPLVATCRIGFPDRPGDCEALAVVAEQDTIYLAKKSKDRSDIYRLSLSAVLRGGNQGARKCGRIVFPKPMMLGFSKLTKSMALGQQATGMDVGASGDVAFLSYTHVFRAGLADLQRQGTQVVAVGYPDLPQAEALALPDWDRGAVWILSEGRPARIVRVPLR